MSEVALLKLQYFGHAVGESAGVLQGTAEDKRYQRKPGRQWTDDIKHWSGKELLTIWKNGNRQRRLEMLHKRMVANSQRGRSINEWMNEWMNSDALLKNSTRGTQSHQSANYWQPTVVDADRPLYACLFKTGRILRIEL